MTYASAALVRPALAALALTTSIVSAGATAAAKPSASTPPPAESRAHTADETTELGEKARQRSEAQQRAWDRKMKALTGSICTGC